MPTFTTPEPITATIDLPAGHVLLRASDRADTSVDVVPSDAAESADVRAAEQTTVDYADGQLTVRAPKAKTSLRSLFGRPGSIDVTVDLPADSRVDVQVWAHVRSEGRLGDATIDTAAGSVRLDDTGRLKVKTAAGDVSVSRVAGNAEVTTAAGKVRIGDVDGTVVAKTSSGDITLGAAAGDARLNTAYGDIAVARAVASVVAKTAHGSMRVGEVARGPVVLETAFGEIEVGVRDGTTAWLDARSKFGTVRSEMDAADEPDPSGPAVEIRAHTGFGDVVVRRAQPAHEGTA
jgi:DUF4097 and DUF4098 domain-containing protein YvlB